MNQIRSWTGFWLIGLMSIAATAEPSTKARSQSTKPYTEAKINFIRKYAWPKKPSFADTADLFSDRLNSESRANISAPKQGASPPAVPPESPKGANEN